MPADRQVPRPSLDEAREVLRQFDANGDGVLQQKEFSNFLKELYVKKAEAKYWEGKRTC